ncbi:MarR family winged helix-turn-helix transcriptional regulator [Acuticoccus sp. I52.16.1]|uniref:MarR family winged helix-turn-helix transcriptional regulator n=1 Tax=Acuticoccus sp. I52.16.1 TaxID=2928472 RepID=UPI001FD50596|nr:winged helix DNA-binding protein [Acuticoccus sp. I52.16.1]UOM33786.1 winged helix DNA-binding protein [Acuticoccus sp. I52.16.1]
MNLVVRQTDCDRVMDAPVTPRGNDAYVEAIRLIERAHRRFLDVVKDELDRVGRDEVNNVQAVLLHNLGEEELTPSELKTRGYYLGSNVSYNLKKLNELGYLQQRKSNRDRRTVRISVTEKGSEVAALVDNLINRHMQSLGPIGGVEAEQLDQATQTLKRLDRFWKDQVLYRL